MWLNLDVLLEYMWFICSSLTDRVAVWFQFDHISVDLWRPSLIGQPQRCFFPSPNTNRVRSDRARPFLFLSFPSRPWLTLVSHAFNKQSHIVIVLVMAVPLSHLRGVVFEALVFGVLKCCCSVRSVVSSVQKNRSLFLWFLHLLQLFKHPFMNI